MLLSVCCHIVVVFIFQCLNMYICTLYIFLSLSLLLPLIQKITYAFLMCVSVLLEEGVSQDEGEANCRRLLSSGCLDSEGEYGSGSNRLAGMGVAVGCGLVMTSRGGLRIVEEKSQAALLDVKPWSNLVKLSTSRATVIK
jgi:hypothetical protein